MKTLMTLWVWTSPELAWEPLQGLHLVVRLLVIRCWLGWWQRLLFISCFLFLHYFLFSVLLIFFVILGASDSTISWLDVLKLDCEGCILCISACKTARFCLISAA